MQRCAAALSGPKSLSASVELRPRSSITNSRAVGSCAISTGLGRSSGDIEVSNWQLATSKGNGSGRPDGGSPG